MNKEKQGLSDQLEIIDAKGYYSEQFLCRQASSTNPTKQQYSIRETILDHIYLAVNLIEEISPKGLESVVLDMSTDISGMPSQLMMRGFKDVVAIPENEDSMKVLKNELKTHGWNLKVNKGTQSDFLKLTEKEDIKPDVILFMDSNFSRFASKKDQLSALEKCSELLEKKGMLLIDLSNPIERIRNMRLEPGWDEDEVHYYLSRETIDPFTLEYRTTNIRITKADGKSDSTTESGFLITLPQIQDLLARQGFSIKKVYGNYEQSPLIPGSPRMILIAEKS